MSRAISVKPWAMILGLVSLGAILTSTGWALETHSLPTLQTASSQKAVDVLRPVSLGDLRSFNVFDIEKTSFSAEREAVPPEVVEYTRAALQTDSLLHYDAAGQGVLKFQCQDAGCHRVKAELTYGENGPVLWSISRLYKECPFVSFRFQPDSKAFANKVVSRLAQDYQKALKATPAKIEITEE